MAQSLDDSDDHEDGPIAVFLYIPDTNEHDHEHIVLNLDEARKVYEWLGRFLLDNTPFRNQ